MSSSNEYFPFSAAPGNPQLAFLPFDLEIEKIDPGIILYPDEPNGVLTVFREVGGVSWWVVNADYNTDLAIWTQVAPANAANPAFAVAQDSAGNFFRSVAVATIIPGNPVIWNQVVSTDLNGFMTATPNTATSITQVIQNLVDTWNAGTSAAMIARQVNITDTTSAAASLVDNLVVNDVPVWSVRKDGTLVVGMIPYTALVIPNPWTIDVPVTFTDPVTMDDGLNVTGGTTTDTLDVTGNEEVHGTLLVDGETTAAGGLDVSGGTLTSSVPANLTDGLTVTGGETVDTLDVTGSATINDPTFTGTVVLPSGSAVTSLTGNNGIAVTNSGNAYNASGAALVETITSSDSSVNLTRTGQNVDITAGAIAPVIPGSWFINTEYVAPSPSATSGSVSLGPLPGTSANVFRIVYWGMTGFKDADASMTFTGTVATGITWDNATTTIENGQGTSTPFMYFGTAEGGTTPTVSWATTDYVFFTPFCATIAAGIQL